MPLHSLPDLLSLRAVLLLQLPKLPSLSAADRLDRPAPIMGRLLSPPSCRPAHPQPHFPISGHSESPNKVARVQSSGEQQGQYSNVAENGGLLPSGRWSQIHVQIGQQCRGMHHCDDHSRNARASRTASVSGRCGAPCKID